MRPPFIAVALTSLAIAACDDGGSTSPGFTDQQVVVDFADQVVIPTYTLLDDRAAALHGAAMALRATPSAATLTSAQNAWIATRVPWEQSEGFLFGPVSAAGYDPAMDSWPVDRNDLATEGPVTCIGPTTEDNTRPAIEEEPHLLPVVDQRHIHWPNGA